MRKPRTAALCAGLACLVVAALAVPALTQTATSRPTDPRFSAKGSAVAGRAPGLWTANAISRHNQRKQEMFTPGYPEITAQESDQPLDIADQLAISVLQSFFDSLNQLIAALQLIVAGQGATTQPAGG